jgi:hypothetical protein
LCVSKAGASPRSMRKVIESISGASQIAVHILLFPLLRGGDDAPDVRDWILPAPEAAAG